MALDGKNERDAVVGVCSIDGNNVPEYDSSGLATLATKAQAKSQVIAIGSRNMRACAQRIQRYNTAGVLTTFDPWFQACIAAGMQAGSAIGESLTFKFADVLAISQSSGSTGWHPQNDANEMIQAGLWFMERVDGLGIRCVRNVTTYLQDTNVAFQEASVNEVVNVAVYSFRTQMEAMVGRKGTLTTLSAAMTKAKSILGSMGKEGLITNWRALSMTLNVDVLEISMEIAPVIPVNFVKTTIHLVTSSISAAA
jgi:hypothetical protein